MKLWVIFMFVHKDTLVMNVLKYRVSKRAEQLVQYCVFCVYWPLSHSASLHHYASCLLSLFVTLLIFQSLITVASFPFFPCLFFVPLSCTPLLSFLISPSCLFTLSLWTSDDPSPCFLLPPSFALPCSNSSICFLLFYSLIFLHPPFPFAFHQL